MRMIDLCSGLGGASQAMRERGWHVLSVEIDPGFEPDVIADVRQWQYDGPRPDLIWASPPCIEFARESMPWSRTGKRPDMSIVRACYRIIQDVRPRWWIIENVRGAVLHFEPMLGNWRWHMNGVFLWGYFPDLGRPVIRKRKKESYSSNRGAERAMIPYAISRAVAIAIESQPALFVEAGQ